MAIITKYQLNTQAKALFENVTASYSFSSPQVETTVFLSHKHSDAKEVKDLRKLLENMGVILYIDWLDPDMPEKTRGETAIIIKQKIESNDKFILLATDNAVESKWCNWELGYGDSKKYLRDKIALFPVLESYDRTWKGSEYMQIYPVIEYMDGSSLNTRGEAIEKGYYVFYPTANGNRSYKSIIQWLKL